MDATLLLLELHYSKPRPKETPTWFNSIWLHVRILKFATAMEEKHGICDLKLVEKLDEKVAEL